MLAFIVFCLISLAAAEEWNNQNEQECVFLITSPIIVADDPISKSLASTDDLEISRPNETISTLSGKFELMKEIDDSVKIEVVLRKNHMTMLTLEYEVCKELALGEESDYYSMLKSIDFSLCPIAPGFYNINDFVVDLDNLPINSGNIGDYEATMNVKKCNDKNCNQNSILGTLILTCVIEPV